MNREHLERRNILGNPTPEFESACASGLESDFAADLAATIAAEFGSFVAPFLASPFEAAFAPLIGSSYRGRMRAAITVSLVIW